MARGTSSFRTTTWDPILIISQIVSLQSLYYVTGTTLILLVLLLMGGELTLDRVLNYEDYRADTVMGWTLSVVWIMNACIGVFLLLYIVQRARLVLDFSLTLHFFHLVFTTYHSGRIPRTLLWWMLNVATCCIMTFGGEWVCMQREMEPILLGGANLSTVGSGEGNLREDAGRKLKKSIEVEFTQTNEGGESSSSASRKKGQYESIPMHDMEEFSNNDK
ncbi:uncharacterized protein VTP21DRAFT_9030 [Calcarisporiella thermophila]|uniref:uncharacterized protein n=1 Tax=Calcarisporiella thermophila TaxID=911321 RepID=UPI00374349B7